MKTQIITTLTVVLTLNASAVGLVNGDFENPAVSTGITFSTAPLGFGWQVASGDIDLIPDYWQPSSGLQSIDLNGWTQGGIRQDFVFPAAGQWTIRFDMSANPDTSALKSLRVDFGLSSGSLSSLGTFNVSPAGRTPANMQWVTFTTPTVTVTDTDVYRLSLVSLNTGASGPALDNVVLVPIPEPGSVALLGIGLVMTVLSRRNSRANDF